MWGGSGERPHMETRGAVPLFWARAVFEDLWPWSGC